MGHSIAINNGTQLEVPYIFIPKSTPVSEMESIKWENLIRIDNDIIPRSYYYQEKNN